MHEPSAPPQPPPLLVCYIPGFDRRRVTPTHTPFVHGQLAAYQPVTIRTQPTTELVPTLVTGVYPHEHRLWQVRLKPDQPRTFGQRLIDRLPDLVTTTFQCLRHRVNPEYDLPVIPPRRRRRFEQHRNKYLRRQKLGKQSMDAIGGVPSVFGVLGDRSRYRVVTDFEQMRTLARSTPLGDVRLDFLEFYAFDLFSHWNLDRPDAIGVKMQEVDQTLSQLHRRCQRAGVTMMLLVDHGQERVTGTVDLQAALRGSGVSQDDYTFYSEVAVARCWFGTDRARQHITDVLARLPHIRVLDNEQMRAFDICFDPADGFGDLYAITDPGWVFFPHDFYHPLANAYMGRKHPDQAGRVRQPVHRGYHGHLPDHPAEEGFAVVMDPAVERIGGGQAALIDVAPTLLTLLGADPPDHMRGRTLFQRGPGPAAARTGDQTA